MPVEDFLMPGEAIKYHGASDLDYGGKEYEPIVTAKRVLLYNRRGKLFKKDELISLKIDEVQGITFHETGMIKKTGILEISAKTKFNLSGPSKSIKAVYQQILQFF